MTYGVKRTGLLSQALHLSHKELAHFGKSVVIAPHPDDESLACGGAIALLRELGNEVTVVFVSDGSMSHPGSVAFSDTDRADVRRQEALNALAEFDIPESAARFLNLKDGSVPHEGSPDFAEAVKLIEFQLLTIQPDCIFLPYRNDPHTDHKACWQIVQRAVSLFKYSPRLIEYPVWLWELGHENDFPISAEMTSWRLDIGNVIEKKRKAIAAHQSQLGNVFLDDPAGFKLTPNILAHFELPFEIFFESL